MPTYHHGVETIELDRGPRPVREVRTAAIALIGTAPIGPLNELTLIRSRADAAQFGKQLPGFTIPQALDAIFKQGNALVAVVNVADQEDTNHFADNENGVVANRQVLIGSGSCALTWAVLDGAVTLTSDDGQTVYVQDQDFQLEPDNFTLTVLIPLTIPDGYYRVSYNTKEQCTALNMAFTLADAPVAGTLVITNSHDATQYVEGDDYTVNEYGEVKILNGGDITNGSYLLATYKRFNASGVTATYIVGAYDEDTETRTGLALLDECYNRYGFKPKVLIAPGFTTDPVVWPELIIRADQFRAVTLFDSASGWTVSDALEGRGPTSTSNFGTGNGRVILCYPGVVVAHPYTGENEVRPMSQFIAGLISATDEDEGHWTSPSNHEVLGVVSLETLVTWDFQATNTQANALNEVGICTMGKPYGSGWRFWGNRFAQYPTDLAVDNFVPVRRVADILHESVELAMLPFIDKPITNAVIASIKETVNAYMRTLIQRGALISGECLFDPAKNPAEEIALGHLTFDLDFMPPTPAERITFESFINIERLTALGA